MKKISFTLLLAAFLLVLSACGSKDNNEGNNSSNSDKAEEQQVISVEHELSDKAVEVPKNPKKVVVFDFGTLDTLDELGIDAVAGLPRTNIPSYLSKFDDDKYTNVGSLKEPDFEAIHALNPDLIIISGRQSAMYDEFTEIAPTIYVGVDNENYMESFKHNIEVIGEIFGKEDQVKDELAAIDEDIAAINEKTSGTEDKALIILANEGKTSAYGSKSRFGIIHDVFGFKQSDEGIEASTHGQGVTFEYVLEKNPDILFVIDRSAAVGGEIGAKETVENELVKKTSAYENGKIIYLDPDYWYLSGGGLQSIKEMVREVETAL
ncbi:MULTISPECIES: siderophore ABC transporter substrate-binding protein [Sporosarcina]|uniref:Siderophore ABC transporter substrate-binding protein n=1 Tax=Sporosarcina contaminans TaxID=633403 RepID=A0ABW3TXZ8_9BACL